MQEGSRLLMKTDSLFYQIFQQFPASFFELINRTASDAAAYQFTSVELKQVAFRIDGVFLPKQEESTQPFYLVEVQFQPDDSLYYRVFGELFLYLKQNQPPHPWRVVIIYPNRRIEREQELQFAEMLELSRVSRIYLDELNDSTESLEIQVLQLVIQDTESAATERAKQLIARSQSQITSEEVRRQFIELIETIIVYKLPQKSREEIEAMLGLSELRQTKVYQEAFSEGKIEGKIEAIPKMIQKGISLEEIANILDLPLETVQQNIPNFEGKSPI